MVALKKERFNYQEQSFNRANLQPQHEVRTKARTKVLSPMVSSILLIMCVVAMGTVVVHRSAVITQKNHQLIVMKSELNGMIEDQQHLKIEVARLNSLTRIEEIAREELGLRPPRPDQIVVVKPDESIVKP